MSLLVAQAPTRERGGGPSTSKEEEGKKKNQVIKHPGQRLMPDVIVKPDYSALKDPGKNETKESRAEIEFSKLARRINKKRNSL